MNNSQKYTGFFQLLILSVLILFSAGCEIPEASENAEISYHIRNESHIYLGIDWSDGGRLKSKSKSPSQWDVFYLNQLQDSIYTIQNYDKLYLCPDNKSNGLIAVTNQPDSALKFSLHLSDLQSTPIRDDNGQYFQADTSGVVLLKTTFADEAQHFKFIRAQKSGGTQFTTNQLLPLIAGILCGLFSIALFHNTKKNWPAVVLLLLCCVFIRLFAILLNDHLFVWDEQFHALVAKNMMDNPFKPMLYKLPLLPFETDDWASSHIWLHKQPLFMWQMALSMKIFGVNVFALRLPGLIMSVITTGMIWRIGMLMLNRTAAFYGAFIFTFSFYANELVAGACHTDHNDSTFLFYVCASIWSWVEYERSSGNKKYLFLTLIGLFSGCAVLVKWLTGLLVYAGWGLSVSLIRERRNSPKHYFHMLLALLTSLVVFLPWQLYILKAFPEESRYEFALNSRHFTEAIEGHGGDFSYHFLKTTELYGVSGILLVGCVVWMIHSLKDKLWRVAIAAWIIIVYVFFTLAATKMIAFPFMISFLIYLSFGLGIFAITDALGSVKKASKKFATVLGIVILLAVCFITFDFNRFRENHTTWKQDPYSFTPIRQKTLPVIKSLNTMLANPEKTVVFNCRNNDNIQIMFFTDVAASYCEVPSNATIEKLISEHYDVAVFNNDELPEYIWRDSRVQILEGYWH